MDFTLNSIFSFHWSKSCKVTNMHVASSIALWSYQKESTGPYNMGQLQHGHIQTNTQTYFKNRQMGFFVIGPRILNLL